MRSASISVVAENEYLAYIDESGNEDLDTAKQGATDFFVSTAVLTTSSARGRLREGVEEIESSNFGGSHLKSSSVGSNWSRRLIVIQKIANLEFDYFCVAINKSRIDATSGLQHKKSFRKFMLQMLSERIHQTGANFHVIHDEHGGRKFQTEFNHYMETRFQTNLFQEISFAFQNDSIEPILRLSDFLAGTWRYLLEDPKADDARKIRSLLRHREIEVHQWPLSGQLLPTGKVDHSDFAIVRDYSLRSATEYVDSVGQESDEVSRYRAAFLRIVLSETVETLDRDAVIPTKLVEVKLRRLGFPYRSTQWIQREVVGYLRDQGILIAGTRDGVRLITRSDDISAYVDQVARVTIPMLRRLGRARMAIKAVTINQLDILGDESRVHLKNILDAYSDSNLGLEYL